MNMEKKIEKNWSRKKEENEQSKSRLDLIKNLANRSCFSNRKDKKHERRNYRRKGRRRIQLSAFITPIS